MLLLAAAIAGAGAAYAAATVAAAAMGMIEGKPERAGRALIVLGVAESLAIYGVLLAIMTEH